MTAASAEIMEGSTAEDTQITEKPMTESSAMTIVVTAAVIERDGRYFVTRRQDGVHLEGYWEFPGGKCESGETDHACLAREIREELGVEVRVLDRLLSVSHAYPDRVVELHFYACEMLGTPVPRLAQDMRWVAREELRTLEFPPADAELIEMLTAGTDEDGARGSGLGTRR